MVRCNYLSECLANALLFVNATWTFPLNKSARRSWLLTCFFFFCPLRSLYECGGVDRLVNITRQRQRYNARVIKFSSQVLYTMWQHQELREVYKSGKWKESDFVTRTIAAQKVSWMARVLSMLSHPLLMGSNFSCLKLKICRTIAPHSKFLYANSGLSLDVEIF